MTKSPVFRLLMLCAIASAPCFFGCNKSTTSAAPAAQTVSGETKSSRDELEQAAASVVAAAKQNVAMANSQDEAVNQVQMALEALRLIGLMGNLNTETTTAKLLDDLQADASTEVAEAIIQLRLARNLRQWNQLTASARTQAIDRFVADVKQNGLTPGHAELVIRLADMLEGPDGSKLAAKAINDLLPAFRASKDQSVQHMAQLLEGTVRRMPGNKFELEGKLLDGSPLDWNSYRGKVVLVDYFASWCMPCRAEVPNVLANYAAYRDKGFAVVGVNMNKIVERPDVELYRKETGFHFPTVFSDDPNATGWDSPMGRKYGITALPRAILVGKDGVIVTAEARGEELGAQLQQLLGPPGNPADSTSTRKPDSAVVPASAEVQDAAPAAVPEGDAAPAVPADN